MVNATTASAVGTGVAPNTDGLLPDHPACSPDAVQLWPSHGDANHGDWVQIEQTDTVPTNGDTCFTFYFAGVFENYHYLQGETANNSDAYMLVNMIVGGAVVATLNYSWETTLPQIIQLTNAQVPAVGDGTVCDIDGTPNNWGYVPWTQYTINLCKYAGQQVTFQAIFYDCDAGGHYGFGYISCLNWESCPPPAMTITKTNVPSGLVSPGEVIDYTLTYKNNGTGPADGVVINDTIPTGTTLVAGSITSNPIAFFTSEVGNDIVWDVGYVAAGASGTLSFQVTAPDSKCVTFTNVAQETDLTVACGTTPPQSNPVTNWLGGCTPTPSPTYTASDTATATNTKTPSPTYTASDTTTSTASPTNTKTATYTPTPTNTNTDTVTPTNTPSVTNTPTPTNTKTNTVTPTNTPTNTNTPTPTNTPLPTNTPTNTSTSTEIFTSTSTNTSTYTNTPTNTSTGTNTSTNTVMPTNTPTLTNTSTPTNTPTSTNTPINTIISTVVVAPSNTPTNPTPINTIISTVVTGPSNTPTVDPTPINTIVSTIVSAPTNTPTIDPTPMNSFTVTETPTISDTPIFTNTTTFTYTSTNSFSPTNTSTESCTRTPTNTQVATNTKTATLTNTDTRTSTTTFTFTATPTLTLTPTPMSTVQVSMNKTVSSSTAVSGNILTYTLSLVVTGNMVSGVVVMDTLPDYVTYVGSGINNPSTLPTPVFQPTIGQLIWTLPPLNPGAYQLSYQTQVNNLVPGETQLINRAVMTYPGSGPVTSVAPVIVVGEYLVNIGVYNEAGELVEQLFSEELSQPIESIAFGASNTITAINSPGGAVTVYFADQPIAVWNGSNSVGNPVTNGTYLIKAENINNSNNMVTTTTLEAIVSRTLYQITVLIYNEAGEVVRHLYAYVSNPGETSVSNMSLSASMIAPSEIGASVTPSQLNILLSNGTTIIWDGKSDSGSFVQNGVYLVEVQAGTGTGALIVQQVSVEGNNSSSGAGVVTAWPNVLNGSIGPMVTTLHTNSSLSLTLKASIYTVAGELVHVIEGSPGSNQVVWNGAGVASGVYLAQVDEFDANGGLLNRQVIKIAVIR